MQVSSASLSKQNKGHLMSVILWRLRWSREAEAASNQLEEVGCRARPSGEINTQGRIVFCSDWKPFTSWM